MPFLQDISLRLNLEGRWKAVYLNDVLVPSEIPLDWDTYSKQQKRWFAGKMVPKSLSKSAAVGFKSVRCVVFF